MALGLRRKPIEQTRPEPAKPESASPPTEGPKSAEPEGPAAKWAPPVPATPAAEPKPARDVKRDRELQELKTRLHGHIIEKLDLTQLDREKPEHQEQVRSVLMELAQREASLLDHKSQQKLVADVLNEIFGLGPLEALLTDPDISDIMINGAKQTYIERKGQTVLTDITFRDDKHLMQIIDRIVSKLGRRCDESSPLVDARLPDGSRVNAVIPPIAIDGPSMSIRRFGKDPVRINDLINFKSIAPEMVEFMAAAVAARLNVFVVGGTGSGKTTLLNNLSSFVPHNERLVTIEDAAELQLQQPHVVRLETRPPNIEGKGEITARDLVKNALRMRPTRIILGEIRGGEAIDMLQAMNTGHEGSMSTIHANTTRDAVSRVETLIAMSGIELPIKAIRQQFAAAIDLLILANRLVGGPRRVMNITEVQGMEGDIITMQDLFVYKQEGVDGEGKAYGKFYATGIRPKCFDRLARTGYKLDPSLFQQRTLMADH